MTYGASHILIGEGWGVFSGGGPRKDIAVKEGGGGGG